MQPTAALPAKNLSLMPARKAKLPAVIPAAATRSLSITEVFQKHSMQQNGNSASSHMGLKPPVQSVSGVKRKMPDSDANSASLASDPNAEPPAGQKLKCVKWADMHSKALFTIQLFTPADFELNIIESAPTEAVDEEDENETSMDIYVDSSRSNNKGTTVKDKWASYVVDNQQRNNSSPGELIAHSDAAAAANIEKSAISRGSAQQDSDINMDSGNSCIETKDSLDAEDGEGVWPDFMQQLHYRLVEWLEKQITDVDRELYVLELITSHGQSLLRVSDELTSLPSSSALTDEDIEKRIQEALKLEV